MPTLSARLRALVALILAPVGSAAASPDFPPVGPRDDAPVVGRLGVAWLPGGTPLFRAAERDRLETGLAVAWRVHQRVGLDLRVDGGADWTALGRSHVGPGALSLATRLLVLTQDAAPLDLELAWQATLPWSFDAGASGTDELDSTLLGALGRDVGDLRLDGILGLGIVGDPLRPASQDDLPLAWASARWRTPVGDLQARVGGAVATARNPARLQALAGFERRGPLLLGAQAGVGLTPASPDWSLRLWTGWQVGGRRDATAMASAGCLESCGD